MTGDSRTTLRGRLGSMRRQLSSPRAVWVRGLPTEVDFWSKFLQTGGLSYPDDYRRRMDPDAPIDDPYLLAALDRVGGSAVKLLDVGAGPLTSIGKRDPRNPDRAIEITAVDPLADAYDKLLRDCSLTPPVRTLQCLGEDVAERFGDGQFDLAYARNSVDHAADPVAVIASMIAAIRPGGEVVLLHLRREGEAEGYTALHQWNFDVFDGRLVLFNRRRHVDVAERFAADATTSASLIGADADAAWLVATLTRRSRTTERTAQP